MLKRLFIVTLLVLMVAVCFWGAKLLTGARVAAQAPTKPVAFTATRFEATYDAGSPIPRDTETKTWAVRSDGSTVELFHRSDPVGGIKTYYIKRITDVPGKKQIVVDPFSESTTTYPLLDKAIAFHAAKPSSSCGGQADGYILGYPVTRTEETLDKEQVGPPIDEIKTVAWPTPRLNCYPLRREYTIFKDGKELQHTLETLLAVTEGEPDPRLFDVPVNYTERPPSEVMAEAARRFPNAKSFDCGTCSQARKDDVYYHAQQHHRQPQ